MGTCLYFQAVPRCGECIEYIYIVFLCNIIINTKHTLSIFKKLDVSSSFQQYVKTIHD